MKKEHFYFVREQFSCLQNGANCWVDSLYDCMITNVVHEKYYEKDTQSETPKFTIVDPRCITYTFGGIATEERAIEIIEFMKATEVLFI